MKSGKICFINTLPRAYQFFLKPQMERLNRRGFQLTFISSYDASLSSDFPKEYRYLVVPMKRGLDILHMPGLVRTYYRIFRKERFDLIQYSGPNAALYASLAGRMAQLPVRIYAQWGIRYVGYKGVARWTLKWVERLICRCSTIIEPDSHGNLDFSISEGLYPSDKGRVIWNGSACGVDFKKFDSAMKDEWRRACRISLGLPCEAFVLGFVGALRRDKGLNELLMATRSLEGAYPPQWLLLVGDKDLYATVDPGLRAWAEGSPRVIIVEPTPDVPKYLSAMDLFVFPSYREGFGSVVIEAEAMGLPVIVTDIPGPVDAMRPGITGLTVRARDWRELARAIHDLSMNPDRLRLMGVAAVSFVRKQFDQEELMRRFVADKERLLAGTDREGELCPPPE